ncbi:teichuronic acid biosynthesis protein TuaB [Sutcliffiella halmapala]|uniref:teichuronic acid biosynthesis protein TuaB n=1 Tax=Sutcliffiella halmapala TaxID=79882 RepID=UPI001F168347|nr:MOP flippase family protein [Sutcliffiella halmapala]
MTKQFLGGMKWTGLSSLIVTVVQLLQFAILARLLSPTDFGLMGMLMVVIIFAQVFMDMGISSALVYKQEVTKNQLSSLYWLNLLAGVVVFIVVLGISPLIASFYNEPRLTELLVYIAFIFLISPIGQQFQFLLQKELKFNQLARVEVSSIVFGSFIAVVLAFMEFGVWALVWGQIITAIVKAIMFFIIGWNTWRPSFHFRFNDLDGFLSFGMFQMGSRTVNYFASNIDYLLIGRFLGTEALGIYSIAYQLIVIPVTKINPIITKVAFPVFSLNQNDNSQIVKGFLQMTKMLAIVSFPILVGLMATAEVLVPVVFGEKWNASIPVIQILCILGILRVLMNPNGSVLLAKGRADLGFIWDMFVAVFNGIIIWLVVKDGINAVALAYVTVSFVNFILGRKLLHYVIGLTNRAYFGTLAKPTLINILMGLIVYGIYRLANIMTMDASWFLLVVLVVFGIGVYVVLFWIIDRAAITQVKNVLRRKK